MATQALRVVISSDSEGDDRDRDPDFPPIGTVDRGVRAGPGPVRPVTTRKRRSASSVGSPASSASAARRGRRAAPSASSRRTRAGAVEAVEAVDSGSVESGSAAHEEESPLKRLRLGLAFNLAEPFNSGRALDPAAASIIRGTLASDHELPRELVRILIGSRTLRAHSPAVIRILARACIDAIPDFIRIALCPVTFGTANESNESNGSSGHRLVHDNTVSVLMSVPGSHRIAVVVATIDALARAPSPSSQVGPVDPVGPANAAKRILSLVLAAWADPSDAEREQIISLVCTAAVRDSNTAPLKALVVSAQGTDFESIAKAIIRTCALADPMDSEASTDSRAWGPGLAATIDLLVSMPFSQHLFGPLGHGSGANAPVGSTIIHIARATVGDDVPARAAYDILRAIVQREPVRSISQSALIPFLITQEQTGPFGPGAVLEGVLQLAHIDEAEMDRCITAAKGAASGLAAPPASGLRASGLRALRLLARANEEAFISSAKSRCLLHDLVRGGCDLGAFFAPTSVPGVLAPLGLPLVGLIEGTDRDGKLLIETALAAGNEPSVIFLTRTGLTGLTGLAGLTGLVDADRRSGSAVIEALRTYSPFANKCPFDSTASGRVMRGKRAHSVSVANAKCFIDLIGTAMRATPPDIRSPPVAIMVGLGLAKYLVYVAVHGAVGANGTNDADGTDEAGGTNGAKEAIDTLKYASTQCGLSLTELIVTGSLVLRAVENKLDSFASDLVALLAAERETHRVVSVALFSDAPLPLLAMVHRNVREEFAERIAGVRSLVSRLASITDDFGISADQDLYRPVASLIDRAGARVAELERSATLEEIIRQYAVRVVQISSSTTSDPDDVRAAVDRLVFLLELNGNPEASIARLYLPSAPSAPSAPAAPSASGQPSPPLAPHFFTAFAHPSIWPHVVGTGTVKTDDLFAAWMQHATRVFDLHETDISRYAKWTGGVIPREALMDQSRARGALLRIAEFVEACGFPHAEACKGILGSEIVIPTSAMDAAMDTDGQADQSDQSATEVETPVVLGGTGMGHGAQRDFFHAVFRSLTGLKASRELALFHLYPTGLVPHATADKETEALLRLLGWVTGSMFVSDIATGYPCIAPAVLALIMGIRVPSLVYALNPELWFTHEADIDIALSCVGPTTEHFTEAQIAEITEQFTARTGLSRVTPETFEHFVAVVEPHFALALSKSVEPIATGFRAAIVGSDAPADVELNTMAALAAILGTQANANGASGSSGARLREGGHYWELFATPENLSTIGSVAAGQCTLTIDYIRRNTTYDGALMSHHPGVRVFWSALARLSPEELAEFFFLWTSMHPPRAGHTGGSFKMTGVRWDSTFRLPIVTHTCFGSIEVRIDSLASEDIAFEAITRTLAEGRLLKSVDD